MRKLGWSGLARWPSQWRSDRVGSLLAGCGSSGDSSSSSSSSGSGEAVKAAYLTYAITSQRFNVLILTAAESSEGAACAKQAGAAGLKVIATEVVIGPDENEVEPQYPEIQGSVVLTPQKGYDFTWELIEAACEGISKCQLAVEVSNRSLPFEVAKLKSFEEHAKEAGNVEIVSITQGNFEPNKTAENVPAVLAAHPQLNVYQLESDTAGLTGYPIVKELGLTKQVKLIGEGGSRAGAKGIEEGKLFGSTGTFPATMAEVAATMATEAVQTGKVAKPGVNALFIGKPQVLTQANIGEYTPQWGAAE